MTFREIVRVVEAGVQLGITHYRVTGGEPLVRRDCPELIRQMRHTPGVESVGMTTNGVLLADFAGQLADAGLDSVNVSLDTLDENEFERLAGSKSLSNVLEGIQAAKERGLAVKLNTVNRGETDWRPIAAYAMEQGILVRFIEMMPIGYGKTEPCRSNDVLLEEMKESFGQPERLRQRFGDGPAVYYRFPDAGVTVGFISAMHHKFCEDCNRVRLTSQGSLKLCLCYGEGVDLREVLRTPGRELLPVMREAIRNKPREHCFGNFAQMTETRAMAEIGG